MIFLILLAIFIAGLVISVKRENEEACFAFAIPGIILIVLISSFLNVGMSVYPNLIKLKTQVETLEGQISTIRNAYYPTENHSTLISGSVENFQQSTNLSRYIQKCAELKAEYNSELKYYQTVKKMMFYKLFSYAIFISNKIYELEEYN